MPLMDVDIDSRSGQLASAAQPAVSSREWWISLWTVPFIAVGCVCLNSAAGKEFSLFHGSHG